MENNNETKNNFSEVFTGEKGKKGVKLSNDKVVVPALYDEIAYTYDSFEADTRPYVAIKDDKYGLVLPDGKGTELTPFVYEGIFAVPEILNHFLYKKEKANALASWQWTVAKSPPATSIPTAATARRSTSAAVNTKDSGSGLSTNCWNPSTTTSKSSTLTNPHCLP